MSRMPATRPAGRSPKANQSMGIRHLARQRALQLLYAMEFAPVGEPIESVERRFLAADKKHRRGWGPFGRELTRQVFGRRVELDDAVRPLLHNWRLERLPVVDRVCLRMAYCELKYFPDIPLRVTLNEYIEMARCFGNDESPVYINAVLDRLAREFPHKDFQVNESDEEESAAGEAESGEDDADDTDGDDETDDVNAEGAPEPTSEEGRPAPSESEPKP